MAKYPGAIPSLVEIFTAIDYTDWTKAEKWDNLRAELRAALVELGTDPAGTFATVKARLDDLLPHFHDRGDPAAWDWRLVNLTEDGAWHDLDLSAIVPAGAKAVLLRVRYSADAITHNAKFRKNGNANVYNMGILYASVANIFMMQDIVCACDSNRVIEYLLTSPNTTACDICIKGWWK